MKYKITGFIAAAMLLMFFAACGGGSKKTTVNPPSVNISVASSVNARVGEPKTIPVTISANAVLTLSTKNAAGCDKLDNASIRCTPTASGNHSVTLTATLGTAQKTANLTVVVPDVVEIESGNAMELFADDAVSDNIIFYAASDWTAGVKDGAGAELDWIGLSPASVHSAEYASDDVVKIQTAQASAPTISGGAGTNYIMLILDANYTKAPRTATITISLTGNSAQKKTITVKQLPTTKDGNILLPDGLTVEEFREKYMTYTENIPKVYFDTGGTQVMDKTTWVSATVKIESDIPEYNEVGWQVQLRGRGNSSWSLGLAPENQGGGKKPYRLRARTNDIRPIFGLLPHRNWAFIPTQHDKSLMRNYLAYMLGRSLDGMDYNPNVIYAELYFNGAYQGLYGITDNKDLDVGRTDVGTPVYDNDGKLTDVGFYIEIDERASTEDGMVRDVDYFQLTDNRALPTSTRTSNYVFEYPAKEGDFASDAKWAEALGFVKNYVKNVTDAIYGKNRQAFLELCDEDSFIDYFTVMELFKNPDAKFLSLYFTRKPGGKLKMGHLWDLDLAAGNTTITHWNGGGCAGFDRDPNDPHCESPGDITPQRWLVARINPWFRALMENDPVFKQNFAARYKELYAGQIGMMIDSIDIIAGNIKPAADRNFNRWNVLNFAIPPYEPSQVTAVKTFTGQVNYLKNFLTVRAKWLYDNVDKPMW